MPAVSNAYNAEELASPDPKTRYRCAKKLLLLAKHNPEILYADYEKWVALMDNDNSILKWTGIDIIGYLSAVDENEQSKGQIGKLVSFLRGKKLVTANHAVFALGLIAVNKAALRKQAINQLLAVAGYSYETSECKAIVTGKVIEALKPLAKVLKDNRDVIAFVKNAQRSQRNATRKKAEALLRKLSKLQP